MVIPEDEPTFSVDPLTHGRSTFFLIREYVLFDETELNQCTLIVIFALDFDRGARTPFFWRKSVLFEGCIEMHVIVFRVHFEFTYSKDDYIHFNVRVEIG